MNKMFTMTVVKDPHHFVSKKIRNDYNEVDKLKINSICNISDEHKSDRLFALGDVFNDLDNYSISVKRLERAKEILDMYSDRGYKMSTILGNHDMINRNEDDSFLKTYLSGHVDLIEQGEVMYESDETMIVLHPVQYRHEINDIVERMMEIDNDIKMLSESDDRKIINIVAVHYNILFEEDPLTNLDIEFITPQKVKEYIPKMDVLLLGHIHHTNKSLSWVCNPNTPIRNNNKEINNVPECSIIDFYEDGTVDISYHELEYKPSNLVFNQDYLKLIESELSENLFSFDTDSFTKDVFGSMVSNMSKLLTTIEDKTLRAKTHSLVKKYLKIKD